LSTVEPSPVAENDPFSLGDSDDEKEIKTKEQTTSSEGDQLKHATVESVSDVDNGCHLLDLLPVELRRLDGVEAS
jgi:hypothetical protein